jgi:hypothetical protein
LGAWAARQWSSPKTKAEWRSTIRSEDAMDGTLLVTKSDGTKWQYSFKGHRVNPKK